MMGPGETIALVAIVGGLIATTILMGTIFKRIMSYKEKQLALTADRTAEKAAQYASHVEQLEARVEDADDHDRTHVRIRVGGVQGGLPGGSSGLRIAPLR